jgi:uncharacterized protein YbjT (DUF2867 family)
LERGGCLNERPVKEAITNPIQREFVHFPRPSQWRGPTSPRFFHNLDVAAALADVAVGAPLNATIELAGPEAMSIAEFVGRYLAARGDKRTVIADPKAPYYGAKMDARGIAPGPNPRLGPTRFDDWFARAGTPGGPRVR